MWQITCDLIDEGKAVGVRSRDCAEGDGLQLAHRFRLLDDDGEVYFEGLSSENDSQRAFSPLDDFGRGSAGCTEIQYLQNGCWRRL